jgi:NitT/TauT family transport system permease protein
VAADGPLSLEALAALDEAAEGRRPSAARQAVVTVLLPVLTFVVFVVAWEALVYVARYPEYILPRPTAIAVRLVDTVRSGLLWSHVWATLAETLLGFAIGSGAGIAIGLVISRSAVLERMLSPYLVASQAMPKIALAPLVIIWFGFGLTSKVIIAALICFFPLLVNTVTGIRSVPRKKIELMRSLSATPAQTFAKVEWPSCLPYVFAGLKVSSVLAVVGAIVGEYIGARAGLGYLINASGAGMDVVMIFVALFAITVLGMAIYFAIILVERRCLRWTVGVTQGPSDVAG